MKKIISLVLCVVMVVSLMPLVFNDDASHVKADGTEDSVYDIGKVPEGYVPTGTPIASLAEATDPAGVYYLTADITVDVTIPEFTGTFDGNGHTVTVSAPLFAKLSGTVKNLTIEGAVDTSGEASHAGALSAVAENATIENVKNTASVKGYVLQGAGLGEDNERTSAAGLVGRVQGNATFTKCANIAPINGYAAGGIVGVSDGEFVLTITNCINTGNITNDDATGTIGDGNGSIGGIIGCINMTVDTVIDGCENRGVVDSAYKAATGGIVGGAWRTPKTCCTESKHVTVKNCVNTGEIFGGWQTGGICGWMRINTSIENCTNKGMVDSDLSYAGGIIGRGGDSASGGYIDQTGASAGSIKLENTDKYTKLYVKSCVNEGAVTSYTGQSGGIVGYGETPIFISDSLNKGSVGRRDGATANIHAGGFIGGCRGAFSITNSVNAGDVSGQNAVGGFVGNIANPVVSSKYYSVYGAYEIKNCVNTGNVTTTSYLTSKNAVDGAAGGIIGYAYGIGACYADVQNCMNTGTVTGSYYVSQLVGYTNNASTTVKNNLATGSVVAGAMVKDGYEPRLVFIGLSSAKIAEYKVSGNFFAENHGMTNYSYADDDKNEANRLKLAAAPEGTFTVATAAQLASGEVAYKLNTAIGEKVYYQTIGLDAIPTRDAHSKDVSFDGTNYVNAAPAAWDGTVAEGFRVGTGTAEDPYVVSTPAELAFLAKSVNEGTNYEGKYIVQTENLDLGNVEWTPIGTKENKFSGVYDGKGLEIKNMSITTSHANTGLFGYVASTANNEAGVANVNLSGTVTVDSVSDNQTIAGLVGYSAGASKDSLVQLINNNVNVTITVSNYNKQPRIGGVVGWIVYTNIDGVTASGTISISDITAAVRAGGIAGQANTVNINNTVNNISMTLATTAAQTINAGGFIGMLTRSAAMPATITNSVNNGDISASGAANDPYVAGFVGGRYVSNAPLDIYIDNCYNTGDITAIKTGTSGYPYAGGILAHSAYSNTQITNCVNTGVITSEGGAGARAGGIVGVLNKGNDATVFFKDCLTTSPKAAGYAGTGNNPDDYTTTADVAVVEAAGKAIVDAIIDSSVDINGFPTGIDTPVAPPVDPETSTEAPETGVTPPESDTSAPETGVTPPESDTSAPETSTEAPETGVTPPTTSGTTYNFSECEKGEQYAENEKHALDNVLELTVNDGHLNTQIRLYSSTSHQSTAIFKSTKYINALSVNAGYKEAKLHVYGSTDGETWELIKTIETVTSYEDYEVEIEDGKYNYIKMEAEGQQIRVAQMSVTYGADVPTTPPETSTETPETSTEAPETSTNAPETSTEAPETTTKSPETTKAPETTAPSNPETGDATIGVFFALIVAAAGAFFVLKKKEN